MNTPDSLGTMVLGALDTALTPERVQVLVDEHVKKLIDEAIRDALGSYSGAGKTIRNAVKQSLDVGDRLNIPSYGHVVCQLLEAQIHARVSEVVAAKLEKDMADLLKLAPATVKLSDLVAEILADDFDGEPGEVKLSIDWEDGRALVWMTLEAKTSGYGHEPRVKLLMSLAEKFDPESDTTPTATIACGTVDGTDLKKDVRFGYGTDRRRSFGSWFGFAQKVLSMYAVGTVITLDEDSCVFAKYDY